MHNALLTTTSINWSGFYKKTLKEKRQQLEFLFPDCFESQEPFQGLELAIANEMVENCIGFVVSLNFFINFFCCEFISFRTLGIPIGLALHFVIDHEHLIIPMAIEEPSVIAAVSGAAKTLCQDNNSFMTIENEENEVLGQILLCDIEQTFAEKVCKQVKFLFLKFI
jgi:hydroxymethylglutaryl-CoA reductase